MQDENKQEQEDNNLPREKKTTEQIVEEEMESMGLNPKNSQDREKFWAEKGLLG